MATKQVANSKNIHPNIIARKPPQNIEAEQSLLGCLLIDEYAPITIMSEVKAEDFYTDAHQKIFSAMYNIYNSDKPIDIVTLIQEIDTMGVMEKVGGINYLTALTNFVPSADNYRHYMSIVLKNSLLRKLIKASQNIMDISYSGDGEDKALMTAESEIYALAQSKDKSTLVEISQAVDDAISVIEETYKNPNAKNTIPTGFVKLDKLLNGFHMSDLIIIAARPGEGKTSIGMNFITHAALCKNRKTDAGKLNPYKCAVFSLEMSSTQIANRMICSVAKVDMGHVMSGNLNAEEWKRIHDARARLAKTQIYIDDSSLITPVEILSKCRRLKREHGLDMIMVDYLQLMSSGGRVESRQQEVSEITRTMKIAAKELNVPILLLSQMSREVDKRTNKKPQMSDLRESGAIEQDADIIMFIYREHAKDDMSVDEETRNKVELMIAKHRAGETGSVDMRWKGEYVSFEDIDAPKNNSMPTPPPQDRGNFIMNDDDVPPPVDDGLKNFADVIKEEIKVDKKINNDSELDSIF